MAKFTVKGGGRGRPLTIDTEKALAELSLYQTKALSTLSKLRKQSSGVREASLLGTETSAPSWLKSTVAWIEAADKGVNLSYESAKQVRQQLVALNRLASKQERARSVALSDILYKDYVRKLEYQMRRASDFEYEQLEKLKSKVERLTKKGKQEFFFSKHYEDPTTFASMEYEKIKAWAEKNNSGRKMSYKEAYAYLLYRRASDGLENSDEQIAVFGG